jgi:hypothetical protein
MELLLVLILLAAFCGSVWIAAMVGMMATNELMPVESELDKYGAHYAMMPVRRGFARAVGVFIFLGITGIASNFLWIIPTLT